MYGICSTAQIDCYSIVPCSTSNITYITCTLSRLNYHNKDAEKIVVHVFYISRAPRFLLKQQTRCFPERNLLYQNQQILRPSTTCSSYPDPPTIALLPLRPKTCAPRLRSQQSATKNNHDTGKVCVSSINPSNAEAILIQSTKMQRFLKTI